MFKLSQLERQGIELIATLIKLIQENTQIKLLEELTNTAKMDEKKLKAMLTLIDDSNKNQGKDEDIALNHDDILNMIAQIHDFIDIDIVEQTPTICNNELFVTTMLELEKIKNSTNKNHTSRKKRMRSSSPDYHDPSETNPNKLPKKGIRKLYQLSNEELEYIELTKELLQIMVTISNSSLPSLCAKIINASFVSDTLNYKKDENTHQAFARYRLTSKSKNKIASFVVNNIQKYSETSDKTAKSEELYSKLKDCYEKFKEIINEEPWTENKEKKTEEIICMKKVNENYQWPKVSHTINSEEEQYIITCNKIINIILKKPSFSLKRIDEELGYGHAAIRDRIYFIHKPPSEKRCVKRLNAEIKNRLYTFVRDQFPEDPELIALNKKLNNIKNKTPWKELTTPKKLGLTCKRIVNKDFEWSKRSQKITPLEVAYIDTVYSLFVLLNKQLKLNLKKIAEKLGYKNTYLSSCLIYFEQEETGEIRCSNKFGAPIKTKIDNFFQNLDQEFTSLRENDEYKKLTIKLKEIRNQENENSQNAESSDECTETKSHPEKRATTPFWKAHQTAEKTSEKKQRMEESSESESEHEEKQSQFETYEDLVL